jgi:ABC-2 type transport system permease protein
LAHLYKYIKTAHLSALERTNGGIIYLFPDILIKVFTLISLVFLWRVVMSSGAEVGMNLEQMLTYVYVSSIIADMLVVKTAASGWLSDGVLLRLFGRPLSVFGQLAAQTIGGWIPELLLFSLPMVAIAPLFGVHLIPASPLFLVSLLLCVTLGFAVDFLFACMSMKLRNMNWLVGRMHMAITVVFSGTVIPIRLLPFGLAEIMKYQPFASLGGAPLSIFVGAADTVETIALQIIWNIILWPFALFVWKKSQEGMVSYGG